MSLIVWFLSATILKNEYNLKTAIRGKWPFFEAIEYNYVTLTLMSLFGLIVGFCSAILSIGFELWIIGLMIYIGYSPSVATATCLFINVWPNLCFIFIAALNSQIIMMYALCLGLMCAIGNVLSDAFVAKP